MIRVAIALAAAAVLRAQADPVLEQVRSRMAENLARLPNYTCIETLDREHRPPEGSQPLSDRLRLEVAVVNGKEMFAWPGSDRFEDLQTRDLVERGSFGYGNFGLYARSVFAHRATTFVPKGGVLLNGSAALQWDYIAPVQAGGIQIQIGASVSRVGYHGSIYADSATLDVLRMEVISDPVPDGAGWMGSRETIEYRRARIGDEDFLLPSAGELIMYLTGREDRNRIAFSDCRKFAGESTIVFVEEPEAIESDAPKPVVAETELPRDQRFDFELLDDIDLNRAAAGDAIRARLRAGVKRVPKDAIATVRLTRVERYRDQQLVAFTLERMEWSGGRVSAPEVVGTGSANQRRRYRIGAREAVTLPSTTARMIPRGTIVSWRNP